MNVTDTKIYYYNYNNIIHTTVALHITIILCKYKKITCKSGEAIFQIAIKNCLFVESDW